MTTRTFSSLVLALCAAAALAAAPAHADLYCVAKASCPGGTDVGSDSAALTSALSSAQASPVPDQIEVGAGMFSDPNGFSYIGNGTNTLTLKGEGAGQTILSRSTSGTTLLVKAPGAQVDDLGLVLSAAASSTGFYFAGAGAQAHRLAIAAQVGTTTSYGAALEAGTELHDSSVAANGGYLLYGIAGQGSVYDSTVNGTDGTYGIYGPREVHRVTVHAGTGIMLNGTASYRVSQALVFVPSGGRGIEASSPTYTDTESVVDHVTVVGPGDANSYGFSAAATHGGPNQHNTKLVVRSSIARGVGHSVVVRAGNGDAVLEIDHSDFDPATKYEQFYAIGTGHVSDLGSNVNVDPMFVAADDLHLQPGSPVIDAGLADVQAGESPTDRDGNARALDGNADGTAATDMGAFEYAPAGPPPPPPPPPSGGSGTPDQSGGTDTPTAGSATSTTSATTAVEPTKAALRKVSLRLLSRRVLVDRRGRGRLRVRCAGTGRTCRISGRLRIVVATAKGKRQTTLGTVVGTRRVGATTTLVLRLNANGRRALARRHRLRPRLVITVRGADGAQATVGAMITVS